MIYNISVLFNNDIESQYQAESVGRSIYLNRIGSEWTEKGLEQKVILIDTEEGVQVKFNNKKFNFDYTQMTEIELLFRLWRKEFEKHGVTRFTELKEI